MKYITIAFFILLTISACTRDLNVPLPTHEPKLTLNAILGEDQPIDLYLTRSFGINESLDISNIAVPNAEVELHKNGEFLSKMTFVDSTIIDTLYSFQTPDTTYYFTEVLGGAKYVPEIQIPNPKAGETYRFIASHPDFGEAWAETTLPHKPVIDLARFKQDSLIFRDIDGYETRWSALSTEILDPAGDGDHYNLLLASEYISVVPGTILDTCIAGITQEDWEWPSPEIYTDPDGYTYGEIRAISDEGYDGQSLPHTWWYQLPDPSVFGQVGLDAEYWFKRIRITTFRLTETYAKFQEKLYIQRINRIDGIGSAFIPSEPVIIPNKVEGGYGMVGSFSIGEEYVLELR